MAAVVGGTAGAAGATQAAQAAAASAAPLPAAVATGGVGASVLAAFGTFLAGKATRDRQLIGEIVMPVVDHPNDIKELATEELAREATFNERAQARVAAQMPGILTIDDLDERDKKLTAMLGTEKRYAKMRTQAMATRARRGAERLQTRKQSPLGAFWMLDPTVAEHTAGCLVMGMKFWPWEVLNRVYPPRHPACPCKLYSLGNALSAGWMSTEDIPSVEVAVRMAAGIVMEAEEAEAILHHRAELVEEINRRGLLRASA